MNMKTKINFMNLYALWMKKKTSVSYKKFFIQIV